MWKMKILPWEIIKVEILAEALPLNSHYKLKELGALELKGKVEKVELLAVSAA